MEHNQENRFQYSYSAKQKGEIQRIRSKYEAPKEDKIAYLRRLDEGVTRKGTMISILLGIIGTLIMGTGMSCILVLGQEWFVPGIIIGIIGIFLLAVAYPVYGYITKKEREKITPEVLRLTEELLK